MEWFISVEILSLITFNDIHSFIIRLFKADYFFKESCLYLISLICWFAKIFCCLLSINLCLSYWLGSLCDLFLTWWRICYSLLDGLLVTCLLNYSLVVLLSFFFDLLLMYIFSTTFFCFSVVYIRSNYYLNTCVS